jgi:hypothetical protein
MFTMSEERARFIDAGCKLLAVVGVIIGGGWTLYTYLHARADEARTASLEARKPFQAQRLDLYIRATAAAATLATTTDPTERAKAEKDFWNLYWGPLSIVEDQQVEASMVRLGRCIRLKECEKPMQLLALDLDHDCRASLAEGWDIYLPADVVTFERIERMRAEPIQDSKSASH